MAKCPLCSIHLQSIYALNLHLQINHLNQVITSYKCEESNCCRDFNDWKSFRKHLVHYHNIPFHLKNSNLISKEENSASHFVVPESISDNIEDVVNHLDESFCLTPSDITQQIQSSLLAFVAKLYAAPNLPRNHVQLIVDDSKEIISEIISLLKITISKVFKDFRTDNGFTDHLDILMQAPLLSFDSIATEYKRLKLFTDPGHFIKPKPFTVDNIMGTKRTDGRIVKEILPVTAQFIVLRKTLHTFFNLHDVFPKIIEYVNELEKEKEVLSNFIQGIYWQSKKLRLFSGKLVFPIFIYYDDFEVNNPLGSHKVIQKVGGTFCFIPCIPTEYQSLLENIFVTLLCHSNDRKIFRNLMIFRILIDEINFLQSEGIKIDTDGGKTRISFSFAGILGDSLALNELLGYSGGFNSNYFCRWCITIKKQTQSDCFERKENLRCVSSYEDDFLLGTEGSGVSEFCVWNRINDFHVYENNIPDIMHDGPEGAFDYYFDYLKNGFSNRPPLISESELKNKTLKMSASEMMTYICSFPFLIGDLVSHDEVWDIYLTLRKIVDIVMAPAIHRECTDLLNALVSEHHEMYIRLFNDTLKPKHHNMLHYRRAMKKSGPLYSLSAFKFESKNRILKSYADSTYSRVNVTFTIAMKEQLQVAYRSASKKGFSSQLELGPASVVEDLLKIKDSCEMVQLQLPLDFLSACLEVPWVDYKGTRYKVGMNVAVDFDESCDLPIFGEIDKIFCNENGKVCLLFHEWYTVWYDENLHAYKVALTGKAKCLKLENLLVPRPVIFHTMPNKSAYIAFRYAA